MNEMTKTLSLVVAGAVALSIAWFTRPTLPTRGLEQSMVGQSLFPKFEDPLKATSLEIVGYDEATGTPRPFQVSQVKGLWCIPSHESYPADAKDQMARAATSLLNLKVLQQVSDELGSHEEFGVVDPDPKTLKPGTKGVGTRVVLKDSSGNPLVEMIVGKEVPGKPELRYVRKAGHDEVYTIKVALDRLPTKFDEWIEKNLLKMDTFDFKQVEIQDYSVDVLQGRLKRRGVTTLAYDDAADVKWKLADDKTVKGGSQANLKLADDEEVNATKLDELKRSLGDLKIIDVRRKPKGLSADLKATGEMRPDNEGAQSLMQRGFYLASNEDGNLSLYSNEGEIRTTMKTGVEYLLRFGGLAMTDASASKKDDKKDEKKDDKASTGRNRYIFVVAQFNPDMIPKPQLEPLPEEKPAAKEEPKKDDKKTDAKKSDEKKDKKADAKKTDEKKADEKKPEAPKVDIKAERERIEKENKRKQEEYDGKVKSAQDKVKELNARFADWYYIIADDVYQKIHLGRTDIVKKKEKDKKDESKSEAGHDHDHDHDHGPSAINPPIPTPDEFEKLKAKAPGKKK
jgi:hypothetical protein